MSRISFHTTYQDQEVEVVGGWDNPLGTFFLDVIKDDDEDNLVYSSMNELDNPSIEELSRILSNLNIFVPENFWAMISKRQGNVIKYLGSF